MFCDLEGFTDLSLRVDPEELKELLAAYQEACSRAIRRFDGHVAQYLGDGVLAYFGFPQAHEDDAERAVHAALAVQADLVTLNQRSAETRTERLAARIGIHTGPVLVSRVGEGPHQVTLALGETSNLASRLQSVTRPGTVAISQTTLQLVAGLFVTRPLEASSLRGRDEPITAHVVLRSARGGARFRAAASLTPLQDRVNELAQFRARWDALAEGRGWVVAVRGEAGIGKSRLLHAFREELVDSPHTAIEMTCSPYATGSAFHPVIHLLERLFDFSEADAPGARLRKLEEGLASLPGLPLEETAPYLAALLGLPASRRFPLESTSPELQRERTLEALLAPVRAMAQRHPVLVSCEDLQWSDRSTLELVERLVEQADGLRMLLVLTFRPEFQPPWPPGRTHVTLLALSRLSERDTRALIEATLGNALVLPQPVLDRLTERADGVPLFAEELSRALSESALVETRDGRRVFPERIEDALIPTTLQASLMARLDRLGRGKAVAQVASSLGREFPLRLIRMVADVEAGTLDRGLEQLVDAEILYRRRSAPESVYAFRHALLQDTAYESMLRSRRRVLHARIARTLEERYPQSVEAEPERMARHCATGGLTDRAVLYYRRAGDQAVARLSHSEAVEYFTRGLELLATLPAEPERGQKEIELRLALAASRSALHGYDDPEVISSTQRVEALCREIGDGPQQLPGLIGLMLHQVNRGFLPRAGEYADELLRIAEPLGSPPLQVAGHMIRGTARITCANVEKACQDLERAIEIARAAKLPPPQKTFESDALTLGYCTYAIALVSAGKPERAMEAAERGLRRGKELGHARTHASALVNASTAYHLMDEPEPTRTLSHQGLEMARGRGFHAIEVSLKVQSGWARVCGGERDGVDAVEEGLALARESGALGGLAFLSLSAAETFGLAGRFDRAFEVLDEGAALVERTGETMAAGPRVPLIRAQLLRQSERGTPAEIERLLRDSLALWRRAGSVWMELRCAMLLAELACDTGDVGPATERLAALYAGFDEGLETRRLRQAEELLANLGRRIRRQGKRRES